MVQEQIAQHQMGFDAGAFLAAMDGPEVKAAIEEDCRAGKAMLYRGAIPTVYVNRKVVPRWQLNDRSVLERVLDEAAKADGAVQTRNR